MNILIIGYGSIGKRHFEVLSDLKKTTALDVVSKQNTGPINSFKDIKDIKDLDHYDYFIIANETYRHFETLRYIDNKVKNKLILVEKPLFKDYHDYKPENKVFVAYNLRFHPIIRFLKKYKFTFFSAFVGQDLRGWRNGDYKKNYSASKEYGGGVLRDLSHEIDYIQYLNGNIKNINSTIAKKSDLELNCEDIVAANGSTKKAVFNFALDYISKIPFRQIIAHTKNETFICDFINNTVNGEKLRTIDGNYTYRKMHKSILNNKFDIVCSYKEGLQTMKIIERMEKSV